MAGMNGGNINFGINMTVNKNGLNQILKPLQQIQNRLQTASTEQLKNGFDEAARSAKQLESIINSSWNDKLGQLNLDKFNQGIKASYGNVEGLKNSLTGAGTAGQSAFNALASQVLNTNLQLKESNKLLDDMATSMANTVKWGITSSIFNNITGSIQQAFYYAKDLDRSLNDIRIVTGDSADQMDRFAKTANSAARDLGRSTLDYTNAALSFYQQGLSDDQVAARTQATLKAQNITGVGTEMVDYLTAVWNGFGANTEEIEGYVDKLAKVADSSASDMSELAIAMSKVASTANVMGVDVDQLTAQLATVIAVTRQAPESVGTAFKTIYSRLNDIKAGADDAQISLGNYSGKMASLGFNVLDANGNLRETGQVIEQIGSRWNTLSREQQIYLAQIMGGTRQVNQITTLFENWTMYSQLLNDSLSAQGTLNEKNDIYLESTAAHMKELATETERTYDILFDQDTVNGFTDIFRDALNLFNDYLEGIGGGVNVFINLGATVANVFNKQIGTAINNQLQNIELLKNNLAQVKAQQEWSQVALNKVKDQVSISHTQTGDTISSGALEKQALITQRTLEVRKALTQEQYNELQNLQRQIGLDQTRLDYLNEYRVIGKQLLDNEDATAVEFQARLIAEKEQLQINKEQLQATADYTAALSLQTATEQDRELIFHNLEGIQNNILLTEKQRQAIQEIINKKSEGQELTNDEIKVILQAQLTILKEQEKVVNKVNQGYEGRKAAENGETERTQKRIQAQERIAKSQQDQAARQITIQKAVQRTTGIIQGLSAVIGGISTAMDQTATASQKANGAWSAFSGAISGGLMAINPMFGLAASGILNLGKSLLQVSGVWDKVQDHFKTTKQRLEELKEKIHDINSQLTTDNKNIGSLKAIQEEWNELSEKAGDYGKNLKKLTEEEQNRYHELVDTFTEYNDAVILGYDAQGEKIIANRDQLQQTIDLLETQKRAQVMSNLGDISQVFETQNTRINQPYKQLENLQKQKEQAHDNLKFGQEYEEAWLEDYENKEEVLWALQQEIIDRNHNALSQFKILDDAQTFFASTKTKQKAESLKPTIQKELEERFGWTEDIEEWLEEVTNSSDTSKIPEYAEKFAQYNQVLVDLLNSPAWQTYGDNYQLGNDFNLGSIPLVEKIIKGQTSNLEELIKAADDADALYEQAKNSIDQTGVKINTGLLMTIMENYKGYTSQWDALRTDENESFVRQLILKYMDSFTYDPEAISSKQDQIVNKAEDLLQFGRDYADELGDIFDTTNEQVQKALQDADFENFEGTVKQRTQEAIRIINEVLAKLDPEQFKTEESRQALASILAASLNLKDVDIQLNEDGKLGVDTDKVVTEAEKNLENARDIIYETLSEKFGYRSENGANGRFSLNFLGEIFNEDELADFDNVVNQINWGAFLKYTNQGMVAGQALKKVWEEAKQARDDLTATDLDFDTFFNSDEVVKHLTAKKKLTDEERVYLEALQSEDKKLATIAQHQGRSSENYIKRLKERAEAGQEFYKTQIQAAKTLAQNQLENAQAILDSKDADPNTKLWAQDVVATKKQEIINLNYQLDRTEQALIDKAQERAEAERKIAQEKAKAREDAALAAAKQKGEIIPNANSGLDKLKQSQGLSSEQAMAIAYLEKQDENLKQIAEEKGRESKEYIAALQTQIQKQGNLTELARQETIAILEGRKARLEEEKANLQKNSVSQDDYHAAKQFLNNQDNWGEDKGSSARLEEQRQILKQYEEDQEKIAEKDSQILEVEAEIVQKQEEGNEVLEEQANKATKSAEAFNKMKDTLISGGQLSTEQWAKFSGILDDLVENHYPELQASTEILKQEWLAGTQVYRDALKEVGQALAELSEQELEQNLAEALDQVEIGVDSSEFDEWVADVESFLDTDKQLAITVHTNAEQEFDYIIGEMDQIYNAASKIGENFIIASEDIRQVGNVFPGILQGMQRLDDGSYQLNSNLVQRAIATAQTDVQADKDALKQKLQTQAKLYRDKAAIYRKMAEAAGKLAETQVGQEGNAADVKKEINDLLAQQKGKSAELAATSQVKSQKSVIDSSKKNTQTVSKNWAGSMSDAVVSVHNFAAQALPIFAAVATAASAAASQNGQQIINQLIASLPSPSEILSQFSGELGSDSQLTDIEANAANLNAALESGEGIPQAASKLRDTSLAQAELMEELARQLDISVAELDAKGIDFTEGLDNVYKGQGIKGSKDSNSSRDSSGSGSSKSPSGSSGSSKSPSSSERQKTIKEPTVKEEKIKDPGRIDYLEEEIDRYHDIDIKIKSIDKSLNNLEKTEKKLTGKDLIKNLNQQVNLLEKQIDAYKTKIYLANQEGQELQYSLSQQGVLFDRNTGAITNYASIMEHKLDQVNAIISYYNSLSAVQQQKYKDVVDRAKKDYDNFKKQMADYDKIINETLPGLREDIEEARDKQVEIAISKFNMAIEIELDLSKAKKDWNQFKKKVIDQVRDNDILGNTKSTLEDFFAYYDKESNSKGLIPSLTKQITDLMDQVEQINDGSFGNVYGDNKKQALEDLQKYTEELMDNLEDVEDILNDVKESFYDMVDAAQNAFDEQNKEYSFLSGLIQHDKNLIQLLYGEDSSEKIKSYNQQQIEADKRQLDFQKKQKDFWYAKMLAEQKRMQNLDKESNAYKEAQERFKQLEQKWLDSVKDFNAEVQNSIQHLLDQYQNNVKIIFEDLDNTLTNGKGLDYVGEEWELINDNANEYLDTINSMYEIQKLQQAYEDAIEDSDGNLNAQKSLTNLMNQQLKMLKDKDKLTKYDVDRANLLLQIEIKRLALQQLRNSKSKLRLRRDSQGNYTYQYTADNEQISQKEQDLENTRNSLYNLDKDQYVKNQNDILSVQKDFSEKIKKLYEQYPVWTEQAEMKRQLLFEQYGMRINNLAQQNENIRLNLTRSAFDELANLYNTDVNNFINMSTAEQNELMKNLVPQWDTSVQQMTNKIVGEGGLIPSCQQAFDQLDQNTKNYETSLQRLQSQADISFKNIKKGIDINISRTEVLIEDNGNLIKKYEEEWNALDSIIKQVQKLTQTYTVARTEAIAAAKAANILIEQENKKAAQSSKGSGGTSSSTGTNSKKINSYDGLVLQDSTDQSRYEGDPKNVKVSKNTLINQASRNNKKNSNVSATGSQKSSGVSSSNKPTWSRILQVYNIINKELSAYGEDSQSYALSKQGFNAYEIQKGQQLWERLFRLDDPQTFNQAKKAMGYKSGGYTGDWGQEGKLGILHEKELILNAEDTKNILSAVHATRDMSNLLKLMNINGILSNTLNNLTNSNMLETDQKVYINATFPAVNSRLEIEEAFSNLINRASQYSFNTRK